jgi:hypothetical protein
VAVDEHGFSRFERLVRKENNGVYVFDLLGGKDLTRCRTVAPVLPPSTVGEPAATGASAINCWWASCNAPAW